MLLGMAFTMSVPMAAWMRHRGHGWAPVWEMTASMFLPSFVAIGHGRHALQGHMMFRVHRLPLT